MIRKGWVTRNVAVAWKRVAIGKVPFRRVGVSLESFDYF
jgi:hypothetical protein